MKSRFQGKNLIKIDEHGELRNYGFNTFDYTTNLTDLYEDLNTGKLCFTDAEDDTTHLELIDQDGYHFGFNQYDGYTAIAIEKVTETETDTSVGADYFGNYILLAFAQEIKRPSLL